MLPCPTIADKRRNRIGILFRAQSSEGEAVTLASTGIRVNDGKSYVSEFAIAVNDGPTLFDPFSAHTMDMAAPLM